MTAPGSGFFRACHNHEITAALTTHMNKHRGAVIPLAILQPLYAIWLSSKSIAALRSFIFQTALDFKVDFDALRNLVVRMINRAVCFAHASLTHSRTHARHSLTRTHIWPLFFNPNVHAQEKGELSPLEAIVTEDVASQVPMSEERAAYQAIATHTLTNEKDKIIATLGAVSRSIEGFDYRLLVSRNASDPTAPDQLVGIVFMTPYQKYQFVFEVVFCMHACVY